MPPVPINASRSFSLLEVLVLVSGFSAGSAALMIAGAAKLTAAALLTIVLTKDRREVELPDGAIVSSPWDVWGCVVSATGQLMKS
jgi:hypothetical protein